MAVEFVQPNGTCLGGKLHTDSDRLNMHAEISYGAHKLRSSCWAPRFTVYLGFVCLEFVLPNGTRRRGKLHTDFDGSEIHGELSKGAYELHSGCWALSFMSCLDFLRVEFVASIVTRRVGKFHTDMDGFEIHAEMTLGAYELHSGCLALCFISCHSLV